MGLQIRIPKHMWNSYEPTPPKGGQIDEATAPTDAKSTPKPTHCKVKLFRFHYGGPSRKRKGESRNEITYDQPCLQLTCANCRKWHAHLMHYPAPDFENDGEREGKPALETINPDVDPRVLDGTWQYTESRHGSVEDTVSLASASGGVYDTTSSLAPVFSRGPQPTDHLNLQQLVTSYDVSSREYHGTFPPTSLLSRDLFATLAPLAQSKWRSSSRKHQTAHVAFPAHEGKQKFRKLLKERDRTEKLKECDRTKKARSRTKKEMFPLASEVAEEDGEEKDEAVQRRVRSRHRVRLVFESEEGKAAFRRFRMRFVV